MATQKFIFNSALTDDGSGNTAWHNNVVVEIRDGVVHSLETNVAKMPQDAARIEGIAIPAMVNVHSHAFQRGFAGLSEYRTAANDSFWTWRKLMYDFVGSLSPEDVYVIARQLYLEMLTAGYSWVGEFQYLHNDKNGNKYSNLTEMSDALIRAASDTGIGICILPVLYQRSGFDSASASSGQQRFVLSDAEFSQACQECFAATDLTNNASFGIAIHSLRAASQEAIDSALEHRAALAPDCPVHIHVAEQVKEIEDCVAATGRRSVEYLLSEFAVDQNWCLIHATHMNDHEVKDLAATNATVGLCPTTEANLGDGIFPASSFLESGGRISIGSDSHCSLDLREELRILEYGQRLTTRQRAVLGTDEMSVGRRLYQNASTNGGKAIGVATGKIAVGYRADLTVLNSEHAVIAGAQGDRALDRFIFTNAESPIKKLMVGGTWIESERLANQLKESTQAFVALNRRLLG